MAEVESQRQAEEEAGGLTVIFLRVQNLFNPLEGVMVHFLCRLGQAEGCLDSWKDIISDR